MAARQVSLRNCVDRHISSFNFFLKIFIFKRIKHQLYEKVSQIWFLTSANVYNLHMESH